MNQDIQRHSPEYVNLLAEVLADPDSTFTQLSTLHPKSIFEKRLSVGEPFLSATERHLIERHRSEVGRLLYEGCMITLQGPVERTRTFLTRKLVGEDAWKRDCQKVLRSTHPAIPPEREELRAVNDAGGLGSRAARLAMALEPSDEAAFALVSSLHMENKGAEALDVSRAWKRVSFSPMWRAVAASREGMSHWQMASWREAYRAYREAATARVPDRVSAFCCLNQALLMGEQGLVAEALVLMEDNASRMEPISNSLRDDLKTSWNGETLFGRRLDLDALRFAESYASSQNLGFARSILYAMAN
ncbi:MAG TPA: hypothetical protein ENJ09_07805 [Planctomycetes bacterium]|nr:hypothetical protein [Planctomycetota bacterium]